MIPLDMIPLDMIPLEIILVLVANIFVFTTLIWYCSNLEERMKKDEQRYRKKRDNL